MSKTLNIKMCNSVSFPSTDDILKQQQPKLSPGVNNISAGAFQGKIIPSFLLHTKCGIVICDIFCFLASLLLVLNTNFVTSMICTFSFQFHASNNEPFELGM